MADGESKGSQQLDEEGEGEAGLFVREETPGTKSETTLASDFCPDSKYEETEAEGEQFWVCEQIERGGEFYGESVFYGEGGKVEEEEEEEYSLEERKSLESEYLKSVLGTPLTFALLDIAKKRPTDPIQYLGYYLLKWKLSKENKTKYEETVKELTAEREAYQEKLREKARQEMLAKEQMEEMLRREEKVESTLEDLGEEQEEDIFLEDE